MKKGVTSIRLAGDFFAVVPCWFADHCLGSAHVKDVLSAGFEVKQRSERTLVIQHRGSETKAWFPNPLFAHGPKPPLGASLRLLLCLAAHKALTQQSTVTSL